MSGIFGHGDFRLYLLKLLDQEPRHGYELIRLLEEQTVGLYTPSAGSVYPRLQALADEGLIEHDDVDGRKVYRITDAGRRELRARKEKLDAVDERIKDAGRIGRDIRAEVRSSVRALRRELGAAEREARAAGARQRRAGVAEDLRREVQGLGDEVRRAADEVRRETRRIKVEVRREVESEVAREVKALGRDLEAFVSDVLAAARTHRVDRERLTSVRESLRGARARVLEIVAGTSPEPRESGHSGTGVAAAEEGNDD